MTSSRTVLEEALEWLRQNYSTYRFFYERNIVWTVQTRIAQRIAQAKLPYKVFNDHPVLPGKYRSISADLALLDAQTGAIDVVAEFKYEPSHQRAGVDILKQKLPVVFWREGVLEDMQRIRRFVSEGGAASACSMFIDEGGYFRKRPAPPGSHWTEWGNGVWVLYSEA